MRHISKTYCRISFRLLDLPAEYDTPLFQRMMADAVLTFSRLDVDEALVEDFVKHIDYFKGDISNPEAYQALRTQLSDSSRYPENRMYYLSIIPDLFETAVRSLKEAALISAPHTQPWTRVVVEKPFGRDVTSAKRLNVELLRYLDESQVYRIDHYLGKETVQNILSFRFANAIFEPVFNRTYIDHIQITASETVGMEMGRGGYYDEYGALRDMVTNHLLQLLCLVTMEVPSDLSADAIRNEKVKILQNTKLDYTEQISEAVYRGQYARGVNEAN